MKFHRPENLTNCLMNLQFINYKLWITLMYTKLEKKIILCLFA
jgi:hypothetical protein